jgi:hypothetical protein
VHERSIERSSRRPRINWALVALVSTLLIAPAAPSLAVPVSVTEVAGACEGSSNPTFYPNNHRMTITARGRVLAVYDPHGFGQQLVWRDSGGEWETRTRGSVDDGFFPTDVRGDRPASIATARDATGAQHAWVVSSGHEFSDHPLAVKMRRLSGLNDPDGPRVGAEHTVQATGGGNSGADLAFERTKRGGSRGVVAWLHRTNGGRFEYTVGWFTRLATDAPRVRHRRILLSADTPAAIGTLVPLPSGMRLALVTSAGYIRVYTHRRGDPLGRWRRGRARVSADDDAIPSAVRVGRDRVAVAVDDGPSVKVAFFAQSGRRARSSLRVRGHQQPSIASRRRKAWVVMVRGRDGALVSRKYVTRAGWSNRDREEAEPEGGEPYVWPNVFRRPRARLRTLVQGPTCPTNPNGHQVLAHQRRLSPVRRRGRLARPPGATELP